MLVLPKIEYPIIPNNFHPLIKKTYFDCDNSSNPSSLIYNLMLDLPDERCLELIKNDAITYRNKEKHIYQKWERETCSNLLLLPQNTLKLFLEYTLLDEVFENTRIQMLFNSIISNNLKSLELIFNNDNFELFYDFDEFNLKENFYIILTKMFSHGNFKVLFDKIFKNIKYKMNSDKNIKSTLMNQLCLFGYFLAEDFLRQENTNTLDPLIALIEQQSQNTRLSDKQIPNVALFLKYEFDFYQLDNSQLTHLSKDKDYLNKLQNKYAELFLGKQTVSSNIKQKSFKI